jgi:dolichol-phosphate mannosyltransferase
MKPETEQILFSVVLPVYNEEAGLDALIREIETVLNQTGCIFEIILVDDGSKDGTWNIIESAHARNRQIKGIRLSRNFGHQHALMAGLRKAGGKAVGLMDGDGQDPPAALVQLYEKWKTGYDVVYAVRQSRQENIIKRFLYFLFYRLARFLIPFKIPLDAGDFSVMSREVVDFLVQQKEQNPFLRGLRSYWGGRQIGVPYERPKRKAGKTKYSLPKLFILALNGIISFSRVPLRISIFIGLIISLGSIVYGAYNIYLKFVYGLPEGYPSIIVALTFLGGLIIFLLGIIAEYLGNVFEDTRDRPQYIIRQETE